MSMKIVYIEFYQRIMDPNKETFCEYWRSLTSLVQFCCHIDFVFYSNSIEISVHMSSILCGSLFFSHDRK